MNTISRCGWGKDAVLTTIVLAASQRLSGHETFDFTGITKGLMPGQELQVCACSDDGKVTLFNTIVRIDTLVEVDYYRNGGLLQAVLRRIVKENVRNS